MRDCPCGTGRAYDACCGAILAGAPAPTAEALMRSRYSAHVVGDVDYIVRSHDPRTRDSIGPDARAAVARWARESEWLGLTIVDRQRGGEDDDEGMVEFQARYRLGGVIRTHHERSRFRRADGAWYFVDGDHVKPAPARSGPSVGRNDPCPCGSGKKHKKCCAA